MSSTPPEPPIVRNGQWRHDGPTIPGVRIDVGQTRMFVADENLLQLATDLADHIERRRKQNNR